MSVVIGTWQQQDKDASGAVPDSGVHLEPNGGSAIYSEPTEDPGGYLEPVSIRVDSGMDYDMIHGEPLSNIEGSVVDSDYLMYPRQAAPATAPLINVDKYKIQAAADEQKRPISLVSEEKSVCGESDSDDDLCKAKCGNDYEDSPLMDEKTLSEKEDDFDDDTLELKKKLKRLSSDSGNVDTSSSLNDLNKDDSDEGTNLSSPNINFRHSTLKKDNRDDHSQSSNNSDPQAEGSHPTEEEAIGKLKKALSDSNEGLIQLYHGKKPENRLSKETQEALKAHNYRMSSSDC